MTKNFVKMLAFMLVAMFSFSFVSCGSDSDNESTGGGGGGGAINTDLLVGLWEAYSIKATYQGQTFEQKMDPKDGSRLEIVDKKNYKTYEWSKSKSEWVSEEHGTYTISGNKLTTADNFGKSHTITIISVSNDYFVYESPMDDDEEGESGTAVVTYKRVR